MSVTERVLLSTGCCVSAADDKYSELALSLIVGVLVSALILGLSNTWKRRKEKKQTVPKIDKLKINRDNDDSEDEVTCVISTRLRWGEKDEEIEEDVQRVYEAVMEFRNPSRSSTHELNKSSSSILNIVGLDSFNVWEFNQFSRWHTHQDDITRLESHSFLILQEFLVLDDRFHMSDKEGWKVNSDDKGRLFHIMRRGRFISSNCDKCPETKRVIDELLNVMDNCAFGFVTFSVMEAGACYSTHRGPTNVRLRCHLGLSVPDSDCYLTVNNTRNAWEQGKCLVFGDCQPHQSKNKGDKARVVLIVDLWHPGLSDKEIEYLTRCFPSKL